MGRKKGAEQWPMPPREQWATEHVPRGKGALAGSKKRRRGKASVDNQDAVAVAVAPVVQQQHRRSSSFAEDTAAGGDGTEPDDDERSGMGGAAGAMRSSAAASDADLPPLSSVALRPRRSNASLHSGNSGDASTWDATGPEGATAGGSKNAARQHRSHRSHRRRQPQDGDDEGDEDQDDDMDDDDHEDNPDDDGDHDGGQEEDDDDDEFTISHGGKRRRRSRATAARPPLPLLPEAPLHQQFPPTSSAVRQRTVSLDHKTASAHYQHLSHRTQRPLPASNAAGFVLHLPQPTPARMSGNAVALPSSPLPLSSSAYGYPPESLVHGAGTVHLSSSALASTASSSLSSLPPSSSAYLVDHHHQHHHSRYSLSSSNMHHDDPSYAAPRSTLRNGPPLTMSAGGGSMPATGAPILLDSVLRWSAAEVAALERAVAEHGADYDLILDLHGPQGTRSRELARFPHSNFFAKKVESEVRSRRAKGLSDAEIGVFAQVQ
ncbi:hypothetical protein BC828DRAFT_380972 [Blastocladiella britannica]|nr:hypothetical protein BC828DRAFT_380972 [Blastocladiella britannica]